MLKKSAFTIAEVLLTMVIIGVIATIAYHTIKHIDNSSIKYKYSNVYHSLDTALYNAMTFTKLKTPFTSYDVTKEGDNKEVSPAEQTKRLCEMLTYYINSGSVNCEADAVTEAGPGAGSTPHFISQNGVKFYISNRYPHDEEGNIIEDATHEHSFFLIFADLNGDKEPNSMEFEEPITDEEGNASGEYKDPDIFAFAALDIGRVCPLGIAEYNTRYMQTRVTYNQSIEKNDGSSEPADNSDVEPADDPAAESAEAEGEQNVANTVVVKRYSKVSRPYYISKAEAWGYGLADGGIADDFIIDDNPLTYNNYVRANINEENSIYAFLENYEYPLPANIHHRRGTPEEGGYNCFLGSDVECDVIIDKFRY